MIILVTAAALLMSISVVDYLQKLYLFHLVITEYSALEAVIAISATTNSREISGAAEGWRLGNGQLAKAAVRLY